MASAAEAAALGRRLGRAGSWAAVLGECAAFERLGGGGRRLNAIHACHALSRLARLPPPTPSPSSGAAPGALPAVERGQVRLRRGPPSLPRTGPEPSRPRRRLTPMERRRRQLLALLQRAAALAPETRTEPRQLSGTLWALAKLVDGNDDRASSPAVCGDAELRAAVAAAAAAAAAALARAAQPASRREVKAQEFSNALWGLAHLHRGPALPVSAQRCGRDGISG